MKAIVQVGYGSADAIGHLVSGVGEITRRVMPVEFAARSAAAVDPEADRVMKVQEQMRADGYRGMPISCPASPGVAAASRSSARRICSCCSSGRTRTTRWSSSEAGPMRNGSTGLPVP